MKLYSIKNWNDLYENNRTRDLKSMNWIPVPNSHDGDGFTQMMSEKNGVELYGSWILILQVASKCGDPAGKCGARRGELKRGNGTPHNANSISRITRAPEITIQSALDYFSTSLDWLIVNELEQIPQDGAAIPHLHAPIPHPTDEEGREGKGRNGKKVASATNPNHRRFIESWNASFKDFFGFEYTFAGSRDGKAVKELLQTGRPIEDLIDIARNGWTCRDKIVVDNSKTIWGFAPRVSQIESLFAKKNIELHHMPTE